jgi:hypothetical protein
LAGILPPLISAPITGEDIANKGYVDDKAASAAASAAVGKLNTSTYTANILFSLTETDTGAKWIDGKTIYRKVINFGVLPNATAKSVAHGITGLGTIISAVGVSTGGSSGNMLVLPVPSTTATWNIQTTINTTTITLLTGTGGNYSDRSVYITLLYTKTGA